MDWEKDNKTTEAGILDMMKSIENNLDVLGQDIEMFIEKVSPVIVDNNRVFKRGELPDLSNKSMVFNKLVEIDNRIVELRSKIISKDGDL